MALILADRVRETSTTTGTGTLTLDGAVTSYQSFSAVGNANTTYYTIVNQNAAEWEVGIGTYTASGTTLSRDTVLSSSNSGSLVNFSAGTKDVWGDYPAGKAVTTDTLAYPPAIGGTTAAAGTFTTLISNSTAQFGKSSVNYLQAVGGATTVAPALTVQSSSDTNVDFSIKALGTGSTLIGTGNGTAIAAADSGATIAWWQFTGTVSSTGNMIARVGGGGTNTSLISVAKGTGTIQFATANTATNVQMQVSNTASAVNYVQVTGATTASKVVAISAQGSDTDVTLSLSPKGAGTIRFGTYTGTILTPTGYITITDSGGTSRRLLVG